MSKLSKVVMYRGNLMVIIPKQLSDRIGIIVGDPVKISLNSESSVRVEKVN